MAKEGPLKVYVAVKVDFDKDGTMLPREIQWEDGRRYKIERVLHICQAPALKSGGQGDRYTVLIPHCRPPQSYLFFERNARLTGNNIGRWFVERRVD